MTTLLHLDSSARPGHSGIDAHGSYTRRLSARFVARWQALHPDDQIIYRDVGQQPPQPVNADWIAAAFTPPGQRTPGMQQALAESDALVDELIAADLIVVGLPMYNFGPPAQFKAYLDNIVRVGRTFGFDRSNATEPYRPLLDSQGKRLVLLSARGDHGYGPGGPQAANNHAEPLVRAVFAYIGITECRELAIEYGEFEDEQLARSVAQAEADVDRLVTELASLAPA
ncbi:NAD(P)H-dependent oxidoreductase [Chitiniphilus purpureus]|uniref:FMN dependent NADH:quinone oxidoreductase n=1 Tax=Chitiniphilus purpureus TaxID=2981137 RepID=A0ABY6DH75_9NEIS|nr:NAD(P)H-dependent oxidoreductase [Chitiniphilus sp. CD1]UXY13662.1 NAD(P)H-dependent oxidoreductase [Chitiniphilus sp. CD1]